MKPNPRSGTKSWPSPNACMAWNTKISSTQTLRLRHQQCIRHRPPRTMDTNMSCLTRLNQRFVRRKRCRGQRWPTPPPTTLINNVFYFTLLGGESEFRWGEINQTFLNYKSIEDMEKNGWHFSLHAVLATGIGHQGPWTPACLILPARTNDLFSGNDAVVEDDQKLPHNPHQQRFLLHVTWWW